MGKPTDRGTEVPEVGGWPFVIPFYTDRRPRSGLRGSCSLKTREAGRANALRRPRKSFTAPGQRLERIKCSLQELQILMKKHMCTGTQIKLLASEMIPKESCPYFGSHMSSDHGRRHFSPIANLGSNNFFSKCQFYQEKWVFFWLLWELCTIGRSLQLCFNTSFF